MRISDWSSDVCSSDLAEGNDCQEDQAMRALAQSKLALALGACALALGGCATGGSSGNTLPPATLVGNDAAATDKSIIRALDTLTIFVCRTQQLGATVQVRPAGPLHTHPHTNMHEFR